MRGSGEWGSGLFSPGNTQGGSSVLPLPTPWFDSGAWAVVGFQGTSFTWGAQEDNLEHYFQVGFPGKATNTSDNQQQGQREAGFSARYAPSLAKV